MWCVGYEELVEYVRCVCVWLGEGCGVVMSLDSLCRWQVHVSVYCAWRIPAHLRCTQCSILLHPLQHSHTQHIFNCTHIRTALSHLDLCTDTAGVTAQLVRWTEKLAGGSQTGRSNSLLARVKGVSRLQKQ